MICCRGGFKFYHTLTSQIGLTYVDDIQRSFFQPHASNSCLKPGFAIVSPYIVYLRDTNLRKLVNCLSYSWRWSFVEQRELLLHKTDAANTLLLWRTYCGRARTVWIIVIPCLNSYEGLSKHRLDHEPPYWFHASFCSAQSSGGSSSSSSSSSSSWHVTHATPTDDCLSSDDFQQTTHRNWMLQTGWRTLIG